MQFTELDKKKALAIVKIFETSKPQGDYSAIAVLNDGAGISYGINQFTHRSGSLGDVVEQYLRTGGVVGKSIFADRLSGLRDLSTRSITKLSKDEKLKAALRSAAVTAEMKAAQKHVLETRYLGPAIDACQGSGFTSALSLVVVYDSMTHGSWPLIRDRVKRGLPEREWITKYVVLRNAWLGSIPRLRSTVYRTNFFLEQIARQNWDLHLPVRVHGKKLTTEDLEISTARAFQSTATLSVKTDSATKNLKPITSNDRKSENAVPAQPEPSKHNWFSKFEGLLLNFFSRFDRVEAIANAMLARTESARRIYAATVAAVTQMAVSVWAFASGMSAAGWIVAAIVTAVAVGAFIYFITEKDNDRS